MRLLTLVLLFGTAFADERVKPRPAFNLKYETVTMHGLPGDRGYYEIHKDKATGSLIYVDANGKIYLTLKEVQNANDSKK